MASLYDSASLVMIPSGYKDDKLYSIKPTDGSGDFTFSRDGAGASPATRVNASGLIEKGRENVILQSNQFDTTWFAGGTISVTGGQSGYDGSNDAWLLDKTQANAHWRQDFTFDGSVVSYSLYVKKGSLDWVNLNYGGTNSFFDLTNGLTGITTAIDSTIEDVGNGWYRCSAVNNYNGVSSVRIYPADGDNDTSGTSGNIYIQDAQLEQGLVATDYIETTTAPVSAGLLGDMPRLDYSGGATCGSLLLEPSRSNLVAYSEYLNSGIWIQSGSSVTDNDATSPEGVTNAAKVEGDGTDNQIRLYDNYTFPSTGNYVLSVFAKAGNNDFIALAYKGVDGGITAYYDLSEGTTSDPTNGTIEAVGTDGWYRCTLKANLTGPDLTGNYNLYVARDLTTTTFPSTGDANGQYVHAYGFQLESGSYPTSYIPTYGSASTRGADDMETATLPAVSGGEVSFFLDIDGAYDPNTNSTSANFQWYFTSTDFVTWNNNTSSDHRIRVTDSGGNEYFTLPANRTERCKVCVLLSSTNVKVVSNGVVVGSRTISADWSTTNGLFTSITNAVGVVPVKQCILFPTRLTDAEAIALTTI